MQDNEKIAQLLTQMEQAGREEQAADIRRLCNYVDSLEKQYTAVMTELQGIKQQLSEVAVQKPPFKAQISDAVQAAEARLDEMCSHIPTIKEKLANWAEATANALQQAGISALDSAVSFLGIRQMLENIRDALKAALKSVQSAITQVETVGRELRDAGNHLTNAGRAAVGREIQSKDVTQEGRFQAAVLAPMRGMKKVLSSMNRTAEAAISSVDHLGRAAEKNRGKRERSSIRQKLEQKKEIMAQTAPHPPQPDRKKSEVTL